MSFRALMELLANKPLLTRKDLAQRYGLALRTVDRWRAAGKLPAPVYLKGCLQPLWRPIDIVSHEKRHRRETSA